MRRDRLHHHPHPLRRARVAVARARRFRHAMPMVERTFTAAFAQGLTTNVLAFEPQE